MSNHDVQDREDESARAGDVQASAGEARLATSYLPLWLLLAFAAVVACGVLTN